MINKNPSLPNVVEMEKAVLGAMILKDGLIIPAVSAILQEDDFYRPEHRLLFRRILSIFNRGTAPNILSLIEELRQNNEIEKIGIPLVTSLADANYTTAFAEIHAKKIKEKSTLRKLIEVSDEISQNAYQDLKPLPEILDDAEKKIFAVTAQNETSDFEKLPPILQRVYDKIKKLSENPNSIYGVESGLADLDNITNGFQKSDLILLAARPSMGKTAFALNVALNAAKRGKKIAIFSLEMSNEQIAKRFFSISSRVNALKLTTGKNLTDDDIFTLTTTLANLSEYNISIDDTAGISIMELRSKARRLKTSGGIDMILIDYLQLMQGSSSKSSAESNRQQEISEISRSLKALARELDVPIIALSQLSRNVELRAEKKPQLSDLRESGSLEQDADIVMFLYREEYYNRESENKSEAELIIAKNRNGPTTAIKLYFEKESMFFSSLEKV
ncbi:MAG: replicative DNA helicase [Selenomonadaceae bacterium]|nr:replicative DNA helicase [Selenomonadaceae bacterium]